MSRPGLDSPDFKVASAFRNECVDDLLVMDWWLGESEMNRQQRKEISGIISEEVSKLGFNLHALSKKVQEIASRQQAPQSPNEENGAAAVAAPATVQIHGQGFWSNSWTIAIGAGLIGSVLSGLIVGIYFESKAHGALDTKTEISTEIDRQLKERSKQEAENLNNRIAAEVGRQLTPMNQTLSSIREDIGKIKDRLHIARNSPVPTLTEERLAQISRQPSTKKNQSEAKDILAKARRKSIPPIPVTAVEQAGDSFVEASRESAEAWGVALDFVSYRTSLNGNVHTAKIAQELAKTPFAPNLASRYYNFKTPPPGTYPMPYITLGGDVPIDQAAIMKVTDLRQPPNPPRAYEVVLIVGGAITLDHMIMKHVVIRGSKVFYGGHAVDLDEVVFVDCDFQLANHVIARALANAVLAQAEVTFHHLLEP